jgi:hypothetical protein
MWSWRFAAGGDADLPLPLASLIRDSLLEAIAAARSQDVLIAHRPGNIGD